MQSPVGSQDHIIKIVQDVAEKVERLIKRTIGRELPINYLTIFSHSHHEYDRLAEWASQLGKKSEANNGVRFALKDPIQTVGGAITSIRIRQPDPYRSQVGCADVQVSHYQKFKSEEFSKYPGNLRLIERPEYEMIEFFDFDANDALAYILSS